MNKLQKNWLEWSVFAVGLALVVCTVGYLIYEGVTTGSEPPSIEVRLGTPEQRTHNFVVPVTVINNGDQAAAGLHIEVVMEIEGAEQARSELDLPFLPRHAAREGWVTFDKDPRNAQLKARVLGYEKP
jgi:uncharacterized protein (TIGR02588 family)